MKAIILAACLLASVGSFASPKENVSAYSLKSGDGQHIPASQVPAPVMRDYKARYPTARNTSWELESEHGMTVYKADFINKNNKRVKAEWLADGTFLGQEIKN
jgi:hypothetical protein